MKEKSKICFWLLHCPHFTASCSLLYSPLEREGGGYPIICFLIVSTEKHSNKMTVTGAPPANSHTVCRPCKPACWCLIEVLKDWAQQIQVRAFWQTGEAASLLPISSLRCWQGQCGWSISSQDISLCSVLKCTLTGQVCSEERALGGGSSLCAFAWSEDLGERSHEVLTVLHKSLAGGGNSGF